ncbi:MAG: hypothetical protein K0R14_1547 [Burkholderiales bacterium]|jgi:hypothetical protein|nr:hypothetical protein [Burkholderiales bacterium]
MLKLSFILFGLLYCYLLDGALAEGVALGRGYISTTRVTLPQSCLLWGQGDAWKEHVLTTNPHSMLSFKQVNTSDELEDLINGSVGIGANVGGWGAEINGGASSGLNTSNNSLHMIYVTQFRQDVRLNFGQYKSTAEARKLLLTDNILGIYGRAFSADTVFAKCGDKFISGAKAGGLLLVDLEIKFGSSQAKSDFEASLKVTGNVSGVTLGVSAGLSMAEKNASGGTMITLRAMQMGGDRMRLAELFGSKDPSGSYAIQNCGSNSTGAKQCSDVLTKIIDYAKTLEQQYNGQLFYSEPEYMSYTSIFGAPGDRSDNSVSENILEKMQDEYQDLKQNITIINEYLALTSKIHNIQKSKATAYTDLQGYNEEVLMKIKSFYDSNKNLKSCVKTLNSKECSDAKDEIYAETKRLYSGHDYDAALLEYIKENNFSIGYLLVPVGGTNATNPKFKHVRCNLRPLTPEGAGLFFLDGCGLLDKYNYVKLSHDFAGNIEISEFTYDVKNGDDIYRFKYPKIKLVRLGELGAYRSDVEEPIVARYAKCATSCSLGWENTLTDVEADNITGILRFNFMYVTRNVLATVYPNIAHW